MGSCHVCDALLPHHLPECRYVKIGEQMRGANNPAYKGGPIRKVCAYCGEVFLAPRNSSKRYTRYCCPQHGVQAMWARRKGTSRRYQGRIFRTELEASYARWLDDKGLTWFYEPKTFTLPSGNFTPDFFVMEWNSYVFVPRWYRGRAVKQVREFESLYPHEGIIIVSGDELRSITGGTYGIESGTPAP